MRVLEHDSAAHRDCCWRLVKAAASPGASGQPVNQAMAATVISLSWRLNLSIRHKLDVGTHYIPSSPR